MKTKMKKIVLILFLFTLNCKYIYSQEEIWTLEECMKYAVENSPRINKQNAQNIINDQNCLVAVGDLLPSLSAGTGANFNFGRQLDPETNTYTNINSFSNSYSVYTSMNIFSGLSGINNLRIQRIMKLMGKEQLQEAKDMVAFETMEAYLNVLYMKEICKLAELQLEESQKSLDQIRKMEQLGIKGSPDVAEFTAKNAADSYNLTKQKNVLTIAIIKLKEKMNFPLNKNLEVSTYNMIQPIQKNSESAADIYAIALDSNSRILSAAYQLRSNKLSYNYYLGLLFPKLGVEAGYSTGFSRYMNGQNNYDPFKEQLKNRQGYYIGFSLSVPIFNGFYNSSNMKKSKQNYIIAQNEYNEILYTVYSDIEQAVADMNGQADAYIHAQRQVEAMTLAHSSNQRKYDEGMISAIELTTSSNRLLSAQIEEINAKYMFLIKYRLVRYYSGESFINGN